jgi:hypothetical protein
MPAGGLNQMRAISYLWMMLSDSTKGVVVSMVAWTALMTMGTM